MALEPEALEIMRRNSGIGLTADGVFTYEGRPLENPRVQALFHRGLAVREDGEVTLTVGHMWAYVAAEGVASFVRTLREDGDAARAELLSGEARDAREMTLAYAASDDRFYAWFAGGRARRACCGRRIRCSPGASRMGRACSSAGRPCR